ncbi:V-Type Proton Atpase Subunit H [Manis pentadactyla]|nr:V-Type Proton Atpase Subunit H [Manis pentadactyla]
MAVIFSVWLLAFRPQMCEHLRRYNIIPVLSDILQESVKEKVTRIILAAFRLTVYMSCQGSPPTTALCLRIRLNQIDFGYFIMHCA